MEKEIVCMCVNQNETFHPDTIISAVLAAMYTRRLFYQQPSLAPLFNNLFNFVILIAITLVGSMVDNNLIYRTIVRMAQMNEITQIKDYDLRTP